MLKFNPDCLRDVLIVAEERTDGCTEMWLIPGPLGASVVPGLSAYPYSVAVYHIRQCEQMKLIRIGDAYIDASFEVADLTLQGHQTLAQLRLPPVMQAWTKAKESGLLSSAGSLVQWALEIAGMLRM